MWITGIVSEGKFKGQNIEVEFNMDPANSHVWIDGKEISQAVTRLTVELNAGEVTEFHCDLVDLEDSDV